MKCGYKWMAPYLYPSPSKKVTSIGQECVLERDHEQPHRSATNVIKYEKETYTVDELKGRL